MPQRTPLLPTESSFGGFPPQAASFPCLPFLSARLCSSARSALNLEIGNNFPPTRDLRWRFAFPPAPNIVSWPDAVFSRPPGAVKPRDSVAIFVELLRYLRSLLFRTPNLWRRRTPPSCPSTRRPRPPCEIARRVSAAVRTVYSSRRMSIRSVGSAENGRSLRARACGEPRVLYFGSWNAGRKPNVRWLLLGSSPQRKLEVQRAAGSRKLPPRMTRRLPKPSCSCCGSRAGLSVFG